MKNSPRVDALLFDLGGVVIDIDFDRAFRIWEPYSTLTFAEIKSHYLMDRAYQRHERGEISGSTYFDYLRKHLDLDASDVEIEVGWNAIFVGEIEQTVKQIRQIKQQIPCFAFSNSNSTHQAKWMIDYADLVGLFERIFVSSDMGLRKPEKAAFDAISEAIEIPHSAVLFFDDMLENVEGARNAGLQGVHVRSPADVNEALQGLDLS